MSVGQLPPHRGLSRAHTTDVRIIISILSGLTTWIVLFLAKSDIWQLWSVAFSHVSVFAGIPSLLTVSLHGNASVSSVAFIPKSGSYLMLAGAIALVTAGLLPFTALVSWFVIGVSAIAIFSQIASQ